MDRLLKVFIIVSVGINLYATEIFKTKTFTKNLQASFQNTTLSINHRALYDYEIESLFNKVIKTVDKSGICTGGKYNIHESYKYIKDKRVPDGFTSYIRFDCSFEESKDYEKLLEKLKKMNLKLNQGAINYKITQKQQQDAKLQLEEEAFTYAEEYSKQLKKFFGPCRIKSIKLLQDRVNNTPYRMMSVEGTSLKSTVTSPIKEQISYKLNVEYIFKCNQ